MNGWADKLAIPILLAVISIIVTAALARSSEATNRRRDGYAAAVTTLVAWIEFPYRVRRRTSDSPEELARLANLGHDLQERLSCHATWIASECEWLGRRYSATRDGITAAVGPASIEAWRSAAVTTAGDMVLGNNWGPGAVSQPLVGEFQHLVIWRFGWRRSTGWLLNAARLGPAARHSAIPSSVGN
jgi:hypothetical protein